MRQNAYAKKMEDAPREDLIQELDTAYDQKGDSFAIETFLINKNGVYIGPTFPEADMVVDDTVVEAMLSGDENVLQCVIEKPAKSNFFKPYATSKK